jgi:hypothetical protein
MIDLCLRGCPFSSCLGESAAMEVELFHFKLRRHLAELVQKSSIYVGIALVTHSAYQIKIP